MTRKVIGGSAAPVYVTNLDPLNSSINNNTQAILTRAILAGVTSGQQLVHLHELEIVLRPGDFLTIVGRATSTTADITGSLTWIEDI